MADDLIFHRYFLHKIQSLLGEVPFDVEERKDSPRRARPDRGREKRQVEDGAQAAVRLRPDWKIAESGFNPERGDIEAETEGTYVTGFDARV